MSTRSKDRRIARLRRECEVDAAVPLLLAFASALLGAWLLSSTSLDGVIPGPQGDPVATIEAPEP